MSTEALLQALQRSGVTCEESQPVQPSGEEYKGKEKRLSFSFRDCRRYSPTLLRNWCTMLCRTDAALKSSRVDGKILMEKLLAEMFAAAEAAR